MARAKWINQAAAIPYRIVGPGHVEVLVVTSRTGKWTVPKGSLKPHMTPEEMAALEALEEAGVLGQVEAAVGQFTYEKGGREQVVRVFPLRVERQLDRWQEEEVRLRAWVPIAEAHRFVVRRAVQQLVIRLRHRLLSSSHRVARPKLRLVG